MSAEKATTVMLATLRRWRREAWELTRYCVRQEQNGWYADDCIEAGVPKRKRCRVCKLLGEIDDAIRAGG